MNKKLNILVGIEIFYPQINGLVTTTMNLLKNFKEMGHNPHIITPRVIKDTPESIDGIPVHYITSSPMHLYPGLRLLNTNHPKFKKIVREHNTDIIHSTAPWFIAKGLNKIGKKQNIPLISTFHTSLHTQEYMQYIAPFINKHTFKIVQFIVWQTTKQFLNPCDLLTAPSPHVCQDLKAVYPHKEILWIPNGIETEKFKKPSMPEMLNILIPKLLKQKQQYAIFVGRIAKEKSVDILLQAVASIAPRNKDFHLVVVGDGPELKACTKLVTKLNIEDRVTFLGKITHDILVGSGLLHGARFCTTASISETHSMTITEALCCGVPVVVPNHPSMTFFTDNTSCHFEPMNPQAMGDAMLTMWENDEVYLPKKEEAKHMIEKFDGKKIAELYLEEYYTLLAQKQK